MLGASSPEAAVTNLEALRDSRSWRDHARLAADIATLHGKLRHDPTLAARLRALRDVLVQKEDAHYAELRQRVREGTLRGASLLETLMRLPQGERDIFLEQLLGIAHPPLGPNELPDGAIPYIPVGLEPVVRAVVDVPLCPSDVLFDVGSGLGKIVFLAHLLTGAKGHGVEVQPSLVRHAEARAQELALDVVFTAADARLAQYDEGTVFFLYLPFTGPTLDDVMQALRKVAERRAIVVCGLAIDLQRYDFLKLRHPAGFWLSIYDSVIPGVPAQPRAPSPLASLAQSIDC